MFRKRLPNRMGMLLSLVLLALSLSGCAPKPQEPVSPLVGDWTSDEMVRGYDKPWVRVLNNGKPLEGTYWHIDASGEIIVMKDGGKLSDHLKQIGQENKQLNMVALREIGSAFPRLTYRVEGDVLMIESKIADRDAETDQYGFVFSDDNNTLTMTDLKTGEADVLTRILPPIAENKK
jgi:hypothetical protein